MYHNFHQVHYKLYFREIAFIQKRRKMARNNVGSYRCSVGVLILNILFSIGDLNFYVFAVMGLERDEFEFRHPGSIVLATITVSQMFGVICAHFLALIALMGNKELHWTHMLILSVFPVIHLPQVMLTIVTMIGLFQGFVTFIPEGYFVAPHEDDHVDFSMDHWEEHVEGQHNNNLSVKELRVEYNTFYVIIMTVYCVAYLLFFAYSIFAWTLLHRHYKDLRRKAMANGRVMPMIHQHSWGKMLPKSFQKKFEIPEEKQCESGGQTKKYPTQNSKLT